MLGERASRNNQEKRRNSAMKMRITVNIKNEDDSEVAEPTTIEVEVPDFEAFTGPDKFGEVFDQYERKVLKARNEAIEAATEKYLSELAQKNPI
jgi:uncharacterized protein YehS (DUF1456 family)